MLLVITAAVVLSAGDHPQSVVTGTDPTTTDATTTSRPPTRMGTITGVTIEVTPATDLHDGQLVHVAIDGYAKLTRPIIILCAGDVTAETAMSACDLTPLELAGPSGGDQELSADQDAAVRRVIRLPRESTPEDDQGGPYDCATEPAGCALVVANNTPPATGVGVAVSFARDELPTPEVSAAPAKGLDDAQDVTVEASGLRPNSTYLVTQCGAGVDPVCDEINVPSAKTDGDGDLRTTYPVQTAIYGWKGRTDCTAEACVIRVHSDISASAGQAPISFAPDAVAPVPRLSLSPSGPYQDQQEVTVTGTGFPPGFDISSGIGQCPADKDTAVEERCGYGSIATDTVIVDEDGRFTTTIRMYAQPCRTEAGCVLGWVLTHGPTLAKVPLTFR
jgi:hypothetical protein